MAYVAHSDASDIFFGVVPDRNACILDVACGTGLVGEYMREHGYNNIDGVDFSPAMLERARERAVYRSLDVHDFTQQCRSIHFIRR